MIGRRVRNSQLEPEVPGSVSAAKAGYGGALRDRPTVSRRPRIRRMQPPPNPTPSNIARTT